MTDSPLRFRLLHLRRWVFLGLVSLTTAGGVGLMVRIVGAEGFTLLEALILALFVPTFAWIVIPFWTAIAGFLVQGRDPVTLERSTEGAGEDSRRPLTAPRGLTALAIPVFNEDPDAVAARVAAMVRSLQSAGAAHRFHVHILSDTPESELAHREEVAWLRLQAEHPEVPIRYRRRRSNRGRKAGNIREFCERCIDDYDYMVVLDADSLMTGATLVSLARTLDANPDVGLVQTVPLPVRQRTLFGRLIQFAGCLYSPMLAAGQAFWQGDSANYWGHNAAVRLRPFTEHAVLPRLPGRPPLGGEILSHDFVEAALLRRAGWKVVLRPELGGSWEEVPGTVIDFAGRDRRWAQGSLQHLRLLTMSGLHPLSRAHFVLGAMGYISSLLWLLILVAGTTYVLLPSMHGPTLPSPTLSTVIPFSLLGVTAVVLFLPKVLGVIRVLFVARTRFGGTTRLLIGSILETLFSVLLAPVMMVYHARFVTAIAVGRSVDWITHPRDGASLTWTESARAGAAPTLLGLTWGGATLAVSPSFFIWMSPIFVGLILAIPLIQWSSSPRLGLAAAALGLFSVPSETSEPLEVRGVRTALADNEGPPPTTIDPESVYVASTDPRHDNGVFVPPGALDSRSPQTAGRSMHNAERGLFDLRQGRPLLVTASTGGSPSDADADASAPTDVLVATVEGLDATTLARLRAAGGNTVRLVLTEHRVAAMGLTPPGTNGNGPRHYALPLDRNVSIETILENSCGSLTAGPESHPGLRPATEPEAAALSLVRLGRLLPAIVCVTAQRPHGRGLEEALAEGAILSAGASEIDRFVRSSGAEVVRLGDAPVPLAEGEDSRFTLFREAHGLQEHVAILVGRQADWPDPVPVRLHSACLTGDLFGSLRCDCGEQLRGSMEVFHARGGGVLLYLAQEGRGIGLRNKFRAYTLQDGGLDTIDADGTLGFGPDERSYDVAVRILENLGVRRIELLTNNPEKVRAMQEAGISVLRRQPVHGTLTRHNLPYVRAKVQRAGHWLGDMLSQPLSGD